MDTEVWRDIPGYEGAYQASSLGKIRSIERKITQTGRCGRPFTRTLKSKILRPGRYNKDGHVSVVLRRGSNGSPVHQLIAITFIGERPLNNDIRHLDGDPQNNRLDNLAYGTRSDNIIDVYRQGNKWRKTSVEQATQIKQLLESNLKCTDIAQIVGVKPSVVYEIKNSRRFWWLSKEDVINE